MVRIGCNYTIEIRKNSRQASISDKIDGKFRPFPPFPQNQLDKMVYFNNSVASLLRECLGFVIFCCPSFLLFYEILNLTLTLYLKAKPSVETGAVSSIYKSGINAFVFYRPTQSQKSSRGRQRKTVVNVAVDDVSLSFFSFFYTKLLCYFSLARNRCKYSV